ncbi:MAG: hypothetical protein ACK4PH_12195 [Aquincola tertiaricarbonis]|uniref:hypothetical protein n=1 Tax=Aquincola TaxID=391952 RepID=UPI0012EE2859|nr:MULTISPECIES: hypothetical protein [Aquincola]MCR5865809.1 hypothetical protein [Aquincola sp. J276]
MSTPGAWKWNSVSYGTTLMPMPARTIPITVASWSTSITTCRARFGVRQYLEAATPR